MKKIKILTPQYNLPKDISINHLFFKNLLPIMKEKFEVEILWFLYRSDRITNIESRSDLRVLDMHDYNNALEVVQQTKPDLIFSSPFPNTITYAFTIAGRDLKIPVVGIFDTDITGVKSLYQIFLGLFSFFQNSIPHDKDYSNKQFMKRGRSIVSKYYFLYKTQKALKYGPWKIIFDLLSFLKFFLTETKYPLYPKFACDLHFLDNEALRKALLARGFKESSLKVTGNPMYDDVFRKIKNYKSVKRTGDKKHVLLVTTSLYEHGLWAQTDRNSTVKAIIREISKYKNEFSLSIKIHPSSEKLEDYQGIVNNTEPSVEIYQKGDIIDYLNNTDAVLSFMSETAMTYTLLARKPIILCNFNNHLRNDLLLKRNLAMECKNPSQLVQLVREVLKINPVTEEKLSKYVEDNLFKDDSKSAERIADLIFDLINGKQANNSQLSTGCLK